MTVVAVAGGTGGVGKSIVESLLDHPQYKVIVLSRSGPLSDPVLGRTHQLHVNYDDISSLVNLLQEHVVHTVISAIGVYTDETSQSQLNLIQAAEQASVTKRFIPSEYSFIQTEGLLHIDPSIKYYLQAAKALKNSNLQYTRVVPGFFMDYWGMPHVRTHLYPITFGIDIQNCRAAIPSDGNDIICMTYTYDMANFIIKLLDTEDWPEFSVISGDETTYNKLLAVAEEIRGKRFDTTYDSVEDIKQGKPTVPEMPKECEYSFDDLLETTALVSRLTIAGVFRLPTENRLNERFPELQPTTISEFLTQAWKG